MDHGHMHVEVVGLFKASAALVTGEVQLSLCFVFGHVVLEGCSLPALEPTDLTLQWLGSRVAHLVDEKVLPLLEGLPALVTDVIADLCVDELHVSLKVSVDHEYLVAARVWAGPFPDLLMVLLNVLLHAISATVYSCAALVRTLVDGGQLLPLTAKLFLPSGLGPRLLSDLGLFRPLGFSAFALLTRDLLFWVRLKGLIRGLRCLFLITLIFAQEVSLRKVTELVFYPIIRG